MHESCYCYQRLGQKFFLLRFFPQNFVTKCETDALFGGETGGNLYFNREVVFC